MTEYEALFAEGTKITVNADALRVEGGLIHFEQQAGGKTTTICVVSADQLLFVYDTQGDVTVEEAMYVDEDDE